MSYHLGLSRPLRVHLLSYTNSLSAPPRAAAGGDFEHMTIHELKIWLKDQ